MAAGVGEVVAAKVTAGLAVALGLGVLAWGAYSLSVLTIAVGIIIIYSFPQRQVSAVDASCGG